MPPPPNDHGPGGERRSPVGGWPIAITGMVLALLAYTLRYTLIPFVFAAVIGFVLEPVMAYSARRMNGHRWPMAVLLSLLIIGGVTFGAWWIGTTAYNDMARVAARLPKMIDEALRSLAGPQGFELFGKDYTPQQLSTSVENDATQLFQAAQVVLALRIGLATLAGVVLTFVLVPYFLISGPRLAAGALWLIPPERRHGVEEMLPKLVPMLRRYVVGLVCVVLYTAFTAYIGFGLVFHLPAAALLSVVVGFLELIPVAGPLTSLLLVGLTGLQHGELTAVFVMLYALVLRLSIDNLVGPIALGRSVTVHPVVVIFAFIVGMMLFGIIGLLLAVPTAGCIKLILEHYYAEPVGPEDTARA